MKLAQPICVDPATAKGSFSKAKQFLKMAEWREIVERKAHRGRLWKIFGSEQFLRGMWEYFTLKMAWARKILADAGEEKQEEIQGRWQQESLFKEVLEQVKRNSDTDCNAQLVRRAYNAGKSEIGKASKRNSGKKVSSVNGRSRDDKVALEDISRVSIAQDFLKRIIAPMSGVARVTLSDVCPHCSCFPL